MNCSVHLRLASLRKRGGYGVTAWFRAMVGDGFLSVSEGNNRAILQEVCPGMADVNDKGEKQPERQGLNGPDAQQIMNAGVQAVKAAESIRTNQSDGSLRKFAGIRDQNQSIEICYEGKVASREQKTTEKELLAQAPKESLKEQSRTLEALETAAKTDPVADVMLRFRKQADAMEPGPHRERLTKLAKEQSAEILTPRSYYEQEDCGVHEIPGRLKEPLAGHVQYPDKEMEGVRRLTQEDLKKLAQAMEAGGPEAEESIRQTTQEILVRTGESSRDTVLAGINLVVGLLKYDHDLLCNPEQARKDASKAGEALGLMLLAGAQVSADIAVTAEEAKQTGDYSLPLRRTADVLNLWYEKQTPADQMTIMSELCAGFGISAFSLQADKLRKPGAFMAFLKEGLEVLPRNPEAERKALEAMARFLKGREPLKEAAGMAGSVEKDYTFAMSKADDFDGLAKPGRGGVGKPLHEKDIVNPIDRTATAEQKVAQLMALTEENKPLVEKLLAGIDTKYGTRSQISIKEPQDIIDKARRPSIKETKDWFDVEHVRDSFRFKTPVENLRDLPNIVKELRESGFEIVKLDLDKLIKPKGRGWRMAAIDLRAPNGQLLEYQILPLEMNEAGKIEHRMYKQWRGKDVSSLTPEESIVKKIADKQAVELYKNAFQQYLNRTGQTQETIIKLIEKTIETAKGR